MGRRKVDDVAGVVSDMTVDIQMCFFFFKREHRSILELTAADMNSN